MSSSQTPVGFTVRELYTRILPGFVVLVAFTPFYNDMAISGFFVETSLEFMHVVILIGLLSLLFGELVNTFRELTTAPHWFRLIVYDETGNKSVLGRRQRLLLRIWPASISKNIVYMTEIVESTTIDSGLYSHLCKNLGFNPESIKPNILYIALMNHMDGQMSSLTKRHQVNNIFSENVWLALYGGAFVQILLIISYLFGGSAALAVDAIRMTILYLLVMFIWLPISGMASGLYIQYMLIDYLANEKRDSKNLSNNIAS